MSIESGRDLDYIELIETQKDGDDTMLNEKIANAVIEEFLPKYREFIEEHKLPLGEAIGEELGEQLFHFIRDYRDT